MRVKGHHRGLRARLSRFRLQLLKDMLMTDVNAVKIAYRDVRVMEIGRYRF
jgi:hypothetical protein